MAAEMKDFANEFAEVMSGTASVMKAVTEAVQQAQSMTQDHIMVSAKLHSMHFMWDAAGHAVALQQHVHTRDVSRPEIANWRFN